MGYDHTTGKWVVLLANITADTVRLYIYDSLADLGSDTAARRTGVISGLGTMIHQVNTHVAAYGGFAYITHFGQTWIKRVGIGGASTAAVNAEDVPTPGAASTPLTVVRSGIGDGPNGLWCQPDADNQLREIGGTGGTWEYRRTLYGGVGHDDFALTPEYLWLSSVPNILLRAMRTAAPASGANADTIVFANVVDVTNIDDALYAINSSGTVMEYKHEAEKDVVVGYLRFGVARNGNTHFLAAGIAASWRRWGIARRGPLAGWHRLGIAKAEAQSGWNRHGLVTRMIDAVGWLRFGVARNGNTHFLAAGIAASWLRFAPARMAVAAGWRRWGIARKVETLVGWRRWGIAKAEARVGYLRFGVARNGNTHFLAAGIAASWLRFAPARMAVAAGWRRWGIARKVETLVGWRRWGIAKAEARVGYLRFGVARNGNTHFLAAGIAASWLRFAPARMAVAAGWRRWGIARKVETLVGWRRWGIAKAEAQSGWNRHGLVTKMIDTIGWLRHAPARAEAKAGWLRNAPARAEAKAGWLRNAPARAEAKAGWRRFGAVEAGVEAGWRRWGIIKSMLVAGWLRHGFSRAPRFSFRNNAAGVRKRYFRI